MRKVGMSNYHVTIHGADRPALADLVRVHGVHVYPQTLHEGPGDYRVDAVADDDTIERLVAAGFGVDRHEDVDEDATDSLRFVGHGNRVAQIELAAPAATYLNVDEVESAIMLAAGPANSDFAELITLPTPTWEGRTCHAIRIGRGSGAARSGVYFLGGIHAREWGSPDILTNFVLLLTQAYRNHSGITQGGKTFTAEEVDRIVTNLDVVVFPQANPDGRHHSMTADPMWRKNRRPAASGAAPCPKGGGNGPGVDINRNYDFLWDFPSKFSVDAPVRTSVDPCSEIYRGPSSASEPETTNVGWLLDQHPSVGFFIDVHSFGEDILYNWGDDDNQTSDSSMNFRNPTFDARRGIPDSTPGGDPQKYREYLPATDLTTMTGLGNVMRDAIHAAHGRQYAVKGAVGLYPTSGTSDDYAYSRHFLDKHKGKVLGYVIEWGPQRPSVAKSFHPDYSDMVPIIEEVTAALLAFSVAVAQAATDAAASLAGPAPAEPS
jgi:carboxypeptidase T